MNYETIKFINNNVELDVSVSPEEKTVWMSLKDMCVLFNRDKSVISRHIKNIIRENELNINQVCAKNATTAADGKTYHVTYYNLDVIILIGYRIKSQSGLFLKEAMLDFLSKKEAKKDGIIVYNNGNVSIDVQIEPKNDTVWLSVNQIATLFETSSDNIYLHIKNIYEEGEIVDSVAEDSSVTRKVMVIIAADGKYYPTQFYNLDVILSVGYRVKGKRAIEFRRWASSILKEYLLKGYVVDEKRTLVTNENYINLINRVNSIDNRLSRIEKKDDYSFLKNKFIYDGQVFDAIVFINQIVETAKETIVLIDPYIDTRSLNALKEKPFNVLLTIVTSKTNNHIAQKDIEAFRKQYGDLVVKYCDKNHDRYLVIDNKMFYRLGASINYLGNKFSQISLEEDDDIIEILRKRINEQK